MKTKSFERGILSAFDFRRKTVLSGYCLMILLLIAIGIAMVYPFLMTIFNAFKSRQDIFTFPPTFLPGEWVWNNFSQGWQRIDLTHYFINTLTLFSGNAFFGLLFMGMAAYALSHLRVPYKRVMILFIMSTLLIPSATYMIPSYLNLKELGLLNQFWAFWLPAGANAFQILLLKSFFDQLQKELFEAARIDGASEIRCYIQLVLPLSLPIFATLTIFKFTHAWNDWLWPMLVFTDQTNYPLSTAVYRYVINTQMMPWNIRFAILTMVMLPPLVIFLFLQRYIVSGLNVSAVKG